MVKFRRMFRDKFVGKKGWFCGNFAGIFEASFAEKRLVKNGRFHESFKSKFHWKVISFVLIWGKFSMQLDVLIAFTHSSYRNMRSYFRSKLIEHKKKTNKRIRILKTHLLYSSCFVEYLLYPIACCLPHLRNSVYDNSSFFLTSEANLFVFQVGGYSVFVVRTRNGLLVISRGGEWTLLIFEVFRHYHSWIEPFRKRSLSAAQNKLSKAVETSCRTLIPSFHGVR